MDANRIRTLLDKREEIDREIVELVSGNGTKKAVKCSVCGDEGHTARTCTKKVEPPQLVPPTPTLSAFGKV